MDGVGGGDALPNLAALLPMFCNTSDEKLFANVRSAVARDHLPRLRRRAPHERAAVIVGGGPSLADTVEDLRAIAIDADVFALNGASRWLSERGIFPYGQVILDARPGNIRFLDPSAGVYFLASQCDPSLFDALDASRIVLWHANYEGKSGVVERHETIIVGGGTVVGLHAMTIAGALGYRTIHLFGFDSSYRAAANHAYPQPENDGEKLIETQVAGQNFVASPWMIRQADDFQEVAIGLADLGVDIHVHGDGLLPAVARSMMRPVDPGAACYELAKAPASWDFVVWLINAEMAHRRRGNAEPLRVALLLGEGDGFRSGALPLRECRLMMAHVMRPALRLVGAIEDERAVSGSSYPYTLRPIVDAARRGEETPKIQVAAWANREVDAFFATHALRDPIVITLRESTHWPRRNSNLKAWLKFARARRDEGADVVFVRDTARSSMPLSDFVIYPEASRNIEIRAALYERARCNLFVANGPAVLGYFGTRPYLLFNILSPDPHYPAGTAEWVANHIGIQPGEQFPWAHPDQRIIWANDTSKAIETAWASLLETSS